MLCKNEVNCRELQQDIKSFNVSDRVIMLQELQDCRLSSYNVRDA